MCAHGGTAQPETRPGSSLPSPGDLLATSSLLVLAPRSTPYTSTLRSSLVCVPMFSFLPFLPWSPTPGFFTNITLLILTLWLLGEVTMPNCPRKWWYEVTILREWSLENSDLDSGKQGRRTWSVGVLNLWHTELCRWVRRRLRVREAEGREWRKEGFWILFWERKGKARS